MVSYLGVCRYIIIWLRGITPWIAGNRPQNSHKMATKIWKKKTCKNGHLRLQIPEGSCFSAQSDCILRVLVFLGGKACEAAGCQERTTENTSANKLYHIRLNDTWWLKL